MFDKLKLFEDRFNEIGERLSDADVVSDQELFKNLMREHKQLTPIVEKYHEYLRARSSRDEALELLEAGGLDKDFKEMVEEELTTAKVDIERISDELKVLLLPKDPNDDKNVIVEIRGGAGGEEAALFAGVLFRMYSM